jgi:hypothetical protein
MLMKKIGGGIGRRSQNVGVRRHISNDMSCKVQILARFQFHQKHKSKAQIISAFFQLRKRGNQK